MKMPSLSKTQRIALIIAVIVGVAGIYGVKMMMERQRQEIYAEVKSKLKKIKEDQLAVLVAKKAIAKGSPLDADSVEVKILPAKNTEPQAVTSLDRITGMFATIDISAGEQLTLNKLAFPRKAGGLAEATPAGKRAITITVDNTSGVGGMIKPGDYVDVIAMVPVPGMSAEGKQVNQVAVLPIFQNILVLAVGQDLDMTARESRYKKEEKRESSPLITLALTPHEANLVAFVQEQGKIRLILRSPADAQVQPVQPATWETLFQYAMPQLMTPQAGAQEENKEAQPPVTIQYVDIIRGLNKERVPLSNE